MRVTKTVREYIEKQIKAKFPKTEEELQYEQNREIVHRANEEIQRRIAQMSKEIVFAVGLEYGITEEMAHNRSNDSYARYDFDTYCTKAREQSSKAEKERNTAIQEKIDDIIVTLELGGTKADLEKMLAEI